MSDTQHPPPLPSGVRMYVFSCIVKYLYTYLLYFMVLIPISPCLALAFAFARPNVQ